MKVYREIRLDKDGFSRFVSALLENLEDKDHQVIAAALADLMGDIAHNYEEGINELKVENSELKEEISRLKKADVSG